MGWLPLVWGVLRKLPWKVIGPVLVVASLALCVRHTIAANARADAYDRVAQITAQYAQQREKERQVTLRASEDSVKHLNATIDAEKVAITRERTVARNQARNLREQLPVGPAGMREDARVRLDSVVGGYEGALDSSVVVESNLRQIIQLRTNERNQATQGLLGVSQDYATCQRALRSAHDHSGKWKVATGVLGVAATVLGILAATK